MIQRQSSGDIPGTRRAVHLTPGVKRHSRVTEGQNLSNSGAFQGRVTWIRSGRMKATGRLRAAPIAARSHRPSRCDVDPRIVHH